MPVRLFSIYASSSNHRFCAFGASLWAMIMRMSQTLVEMDDSRALDDKSIFQSFWMGGFECSTHRLPRRKALGPFAGVRLDLTAATRHDEFALQDYTRLRQA